VRGMKPLDAELDRIATLANRAGLPAVLAMLHEIGTSAFFGVGSAPDIDNADLQMAIVGGGGLGLPDRDYYFREDAKSVQLRTQYVEHVGKMMQMVGAPGADAAT